MSKYGSMVWEYPQQHHGCPLLPLGTISFFLTFSDSWLTEKDWHSIEGQEKVLLLHCEGGGWPLLAFMLSALLLHRGEYISGGEKEALDFVSTHVSDVEQPMQISSCPLDPRPSHLRYLEYVSRGGSGIDYHPIETVLTLDSIALTLLPACFRGEDDGGFVLRVYAKDASSSLVNKGSRLLFSSPTMAAHDEEVECGPVEVFVDCHVQGDVVVECKNLGKDVVMFRAMFNTSFVQSNSLELSRDDIDVPWNAKERFPKDFKAVVLFSDMDGTGGGDHAESLDSTGNNVIHNPNPRDKKRYLGLRPILNAGAATDQKYKRAEINYDATYTPSPPPPSPRRAAFRDLSKQPSRSFRPSANPGWFTTNDSSCSSNQDSSLKPPRSPGMCEECPRHHRSHYPTSPSEGTRTPLSSPTTYLVTSPRPPVLTGKFLPPSPSRRSCGATSPFPSSPPFKDGVISFEPQATQRRAPPSGDVSPSLRPLPPPPYPLVIKAPLFVEHAVEDGNADSHSQALEKSLCSIRDDARDFKEKIDSLETQFKALVDSQDRITRILRNKWPSIS